MRDHGSSRRSKSRRPRRSKSAKRSKQHRRSRSPSPQRSHYTSGHRSPANPSTQGRHLPDRHAPYAKSRTSKPAASDGRNRDHPIYQRANTFRQVHQDSLYTVYTKDLQNRGNTSQRTYDSRPKEEPHISLRSRSRSRRSRPSTTSRTWPTRPTGGVTLRPKALHDTLRGPDNPEVSACETNESQQVEIPAPGEFEGVDWRRLSQEREETDQDELMQIPKPRSMDEDWKISVQKAFGDVTRTRAPCEIPAEMAITLPHTISKKQYNKFREVLREHNPTAPQIVLDNMASIFAQSGKMEITQATGSYSFEVKSMQCYGLFVPTNFNRKPPFDGNDSNVYHIIHGTTNKGASTILAEELIRPGDCTIETLPFVGTPPMGINYSAGEVAAKTIRFSSNIEELCRKILKIGKGTLPVQIAGIYTGRYAHNLQLAGGNEEVQRLCGKQGVARGKEKYTVARSENTTVIGMILYYKNQIPTTEHP